MRAGHRTPDSLPVFLGCRRLCLSLSFGELGTCLCGNSSYSQPVSTIKDIETAVKKLSRDELSAFRNWFLEFDAEAWDRQFEQDVQAGRLDRLADEALDELRE